jgi:hypothetical protein
MKNAVEMGSGSMIYTSGFKKIGTQAGWKSHKPIYIFFPQIRKAR